MATVTAVCPYELAALRVAGVEPEQALRQATKSGPTVHDHAELMRHRDESGDAQVDMETGKLMEELEEHEVHRARPVSKPRMVEADVDGTTVVIAGGYRPISQHVCPATKQLVTLYGDSDPYRIALVDPSGRFLSEVEVPAGSVQ